MTPRADAPGPAEPDSTRPRGRWQEYGRHLTRLRRTGWPGGWRWSRGGERWDRPRPVPPTRRGGRGRGGRLRRQHAQAATDTAAQIIAAGGRAAAVGADLGDPAGPRHLVKAAEDALGPVDVLVSKCG